MVSQAEQTDEETQLVSEGYVPFEGSIHTHLFWTDYASSRGHRPKKWISRALSYLMPDVERFPRDVKTVSKRVLDRGINFTGLTDVVAEGDHFEHRFENLMKTKERGDRLDYRDKSPVATFVDGAGEKERRLTYERSMEIVTGQEMAHILASRIPNFYEMKNDDGSLKYNQVQAKAMQEKFDRYLQKRFDVPTEKRVERFLTFLKRTGCHVTIDHPMYKGMGADTIREHRDKIDALEENGNLVDSWMFNWLPKKLKMKLPVSEYNTEAVELGRKLGMPVYYNEDAHGPGDVGRGRTVYYVNPSFVESGDIRGGVYEAMHDKDKQRFFKKGTTNHGGSLFKHVGSGQYSLVRQALGVIPESIGRATEKKPFLGRMKNWLSKFFHRH
ncbi:MAG: hypothetical protein KKF56_02565 [Nanoarchaeota archaeon]|nr:hypothetical protein [Nanoarchaeota archaeon]